MRTPIAFLVGAVAASLLAAAAFRGTGQPLDSTFTYQGQLRNAGQLVNGNVDVRFTLWDSDVGGSQIGNANSFTNYPLADGRFALGLNFGSGAFNGDQRWVQVEFRNPAGAGQYVTLAPRDKIVATPYALYALNGTASQWEYNPKTQALTSAQNVAKVGIGTNAPTAALEVVGTGGDDAVKLPAGSVGVEELSPQARSSAFEVNGPNTTRLFSVSRPCVAVINVAGTISGTGCSYSHVLIDGSFVPVRQYSYNAGGILCGTHVVALSAGQHELKIESGTCQGYPLASVTVSVALLNEMTP